MYGTRVLQSIYQDGYSSYDMRWEFGYKMDGYLKKVVKVIAHALFIMTNISLIVAITETSSRRLINIYQIRGLQKFTRKYKSFTSSSNVNEIIVRTNLIQLKKKNSWLKWLTTITINKSNTDVTDIFILLVKNEID